MTKKIVLKIRSRVGVSCSSTSHFSELKLQKVSPIESDATSHDPSPTVHTPSKWKAPSSPDSVPIQYGASGPPSSMGVTIFSIVPLRCQQCVFYDIL